MSEHKQINIITILLKRFVILKKHYLLNLNPNHTCPDQLEN